MHDDERRAIAQRLHDSPVQLVLHATGGGMALITDLLLVPGASRTVLEVTVPYAATAMVDLLDTEPTQFVSAVTAGDLAAAALERARSLGDPEIGWGVGITAGLTTDRIRRGDDRAWFSITGAESIVVGLDDVPPDRVAQDRAVADAVLAEIDRRLDELD
ncbi:MAG: hypothetical protein GY745_17155 [Actinomycetia bacterium]|nr:hypothetical protein [Actinomycetes bacterium]MCP4086761.1 hypothetical protein [Actinomycetes bacterium]